MGSCQVLFYFLGDWCLLAVISQLAIAIFLVLLCSLLSARHAGMGFLDECRNG